MRKVGEGKARVLEYHSIVLQAQSRKGGGGGGGRERECIAGHFTTLALQGKKQSGDAMYKGPFD